MSPASSVFFFDSKFDNFLHAPIGADANGMTLSVLSALARLDVDPWAEAAQLSMLAKEPGTQRLASMISRLPGAARTAQDTRAIADRLVRLLPSVAVPNVPLPSSIQRCIQLLLGVLGLTVVKILIGAALATIFLMIVMANVSSARINHSNPSVSETEPNSQSK